jgi:CubicO group peptidase (beta-lactamase class C family)
MSRPITEAGLERLHRAMAGRVERGELPGLVTLVAQGDAAHVDPIGLTAFGSGAPMRRNSVFRIASLTKPLLATVALMLVEKGRLALDEPVDRLLPELADRRVLERIDGPLDQTRPAARPITVEDVLSSRMGYGAIFDPSFEPPYPVINAANELELVTMPPTPDPRIRHTPDEWLARFATLPLMSQPGERWLYNASYLVLGVLVARAAEQSLQTVFQQRLLDPLGMGETGFSLPPPVTRRLPRYYLRNPETGQLELQSTSMPDEWSRAPIFPSGAGGLLSTVDDLLSFGRFLLAKGVYQGRRLLSERSVALLTTNHLTAAQIADAGPMLSGNGWGYGMAVVPESASLAPGSYGWSGGFGTNWFNLPSRDLVAVLLTQTVDVMFNGTLGEFAALAADA